MIDPLAPLYQSHHTATAAADLMPTGTDPVSAHWLTVIGVSIVIATALWAAGGLAAWIWTTVTDFQDRRHYLGPAPGDRPRRR